MIEVTFCEHCKGDPFEYVLVDGVKEAVAISCCEKAVAQYYHGLTTMSTAKDSDLLKLGGIGDSQ